MKPSPTLLVSPAATPFPYAALVAAAYVDLPIIFDADFPGAELTISGAKVTDELQMVQKLTTAANIHGDEGKTTSLLNLAHILNTSTAFPEIITAFNSIDDQLAFRTFLLGHSISTADFVTWGAIKGSPKIIGVLKGGQHPHVSRWYLHIESLSTTQDVIANLAAARASKARSKTAAATFDLGLPNVVDGKVVTRFPPEPSGYLHIGHAKAALLNQNFANMYHGKLIVRFEDTNPTKERAEFEQSILEDLKLMDIRGDRITYTSDNFELLHQRGIEMIKRGKAYADDTEQVQMRHERMEGIASKRRDSTVEENLARFEEMSRGTPEGQRWCIRAKISVDDNNKAMRDPVIFRVNLVPHHRTGTKWKVYPTYDFASPMIDEYEGVTHALRTNEYHDRNPQYWWMLEAMGLRKVDIWDFSRVNFIYTLLSKRKLHMFVNEKLVEGWDDPRFPTVRGVRRRGLTVEALRQYMLSQAQSQSVVSLEWDSIWAINKKIIDPIAPRYTAIVKENSVIVNIKGVTTTETKSLPLHKKNAEVGNKEVTYGPVIVIEQEDAASFDDNEEITLMDWGNAIVRSKKTDQHGIITSMEMDLHLDGDFKKTKKKITWLAKPDPSQPRSHHFIPTTLHDYDYLITKKKLEEEDDVKDFITPVTEFKVDAFVASHMSGLKTGSTIQFERKGYYILDAVKGEPGAEQHFKFIRIPDGKAANMASKAEPGISKRGDFVTPADTKMYYVPPVYGNGGLATEADTKMYKVKSVYSS